jgi:hypothetical protein
MAITSVGEFLAEAAEPRMKLGLYGMPAAPWYFGQPDLKTDLIPHLFRSGIKPELEREVLRDFRLMGAEFVPTAGLADWQILVSAHLAGAPTRILEWTGNPLVALFLAVESLIPEPGRIWVLNPWTMNELTANLSYVPHADSEYFRKYAVKLEAADTALPEAVQPMAFKPARTTRNYNAQNIFWTVHGRAATPLNELAFFMKRADVFTAPILVAGDAKRFILRELHDLGVTRANLFPSAASLARTLAYRYSKNYLSA